MKSPYEIIKRQYVTEKATLLESLGSEGMQANPCIARCNSPKYVFVVDTTANKQQIAWAVEEIYKEMQIKVVKVNTLMTKPKPKRRGRGRKGATTRFKKAVVTLRPEDNLRDL